MMQCYIVTDTEAGATVRGLVRKFLDLPSSFPLSDVATFDCRNLSCYSLEEHQALRLPANIRSDQPDLH